jgi:hypothetical protein
LAKLKGGGDFKFCFIPSCFPFLAIGGYFLSGGYSMNNTNHKRYYSPQFSELASVSVRRFAWAVGLPMTSAVDLIAKVLPSIVQASKVCKLCKDKTKCKGCAFNSAFTPEEQNAALFALSDLIV